MWPFKKCCSLKGNGFFEGFTDWHSHILPGVDDGVQTMKESLDILHLYEQLGVKSVWLTPHIMEDIPNTTEHLRERFSELKTSYHGAVELHLAAENMLDNLFEERLEANDLLPIGETGNHLLIETSYFSPPMNLYELLERIKVKGYYPILAHPERYAYLNMCDYERFKANNVKFQLNLPSLTKRYGHSVKKKAKELLNKKFYDVLGTDVHRIEMMQLVFKTNLQIEILKREEI